MAGLFAGVLLMISSYYAMASFLPRQSQSTDADRENNSEYRFINPLLECNPAIAQSVELRSFRNKLQTAIQTEQNQHRANDVAVYFRDLNNGPWLGINEQESFIPASLIKMPMMIAFFKQAESQPSLLTKELSYRGAFEEIPQYFKASQVIEPHHNYTIAQLINRMIIYSDNQAALLLLHHGGDRLLEKIFTDLGIDVHQFEADDNMSVRTYASFFRILFNASYLSQDNSNKALALLSNAEFKQGLVAGVPASVAVAHKFGERWFTTGSMSKQVHDCGIIYYPQHPYLLCIMTRGDDFDSLARVIKDLSALVYQEVDAQYSHL